MLEYYVDSEFKLRQLRGCPVGKHMDCFADWLHAAGYKRRSAQLLLRGAAHLGHWASIRKVRIGRLDSPMLDTFARHIATCTCPHAFHGRGPYNAEGAKRFVEHLQRRGILPRAEVRPEPLPALVEAFSDWMRRHRGVAESTLTQYVSMVKEFLVALGDDAAAYNASLVRRFIFTRASRTGHSGAKSVVNAIRMFLRFLAANASCSPELVAAVPRIVKWRLSSLPRYISAQDVERLIQGCDPASPRGSRDRAVIFLLARLALRAGDVRDLRLKDIDWSQGRLRVVGKGRCETWLPLPQDAGDAVLHYLEHFRPAIDDDHVFLRVHAPFGPLPSSGPISKLVRRAIRRAGIKAPSMGAHLLRHSAATAMLRQGSSLDVIGAVLRHRSVESTAHYAKVDLTLLRSVVQPWPGHGESPC
jgi:site-specific recombinase XerD